MADFRFMMAFGVGFITVMFLGFLTGFCIGRYILEWNENDSLLLSLGTGIPTLFMEAILMMIRLEKWERKREAERKKQNRSPIIVVPDKDLKSELPATAPAKSEKSENTVRSSKSAKSKPGKQKAKTE